MVGVQFLPSEASQAATDDVDRAKKLVQDAQGIASNLDGHDRQFWAEHAMAMVEGDPDLARGHLEYTEDNATILRN